MDFELWEDKPNFYAESAIKAYMIMQKVMKVLETLVRKSDLDGLTRFKVLVEDFANELGIEEVKV